MTTGEPYVVIDGGRLLGLLIIDDPSVDGHVLIRPADAALMDEWIGQRDSVHPLTRTLLSAIIPPRKRKVP